jgi:hypothetical protein
MEKGFAESGKGKPILASGFASFLGHEHIYTSRPKIFLTDLGFVFKRCDGKK